MSRPTQIKGTCDKCKAPLKGLHNSGLCIKCREVQCPTCKRPYVPRRTWADACSNCQPKKKVPKNVYL